MSEPIQYAIDQEPLRRAIASLRAAENPKVTFGPDMRAMADEASQKRREGISKALQAFSMQSW